MRRLLLFAALLFTACAAHEKAGDRAAALGDWRSAEQQYAEAVRRDPKSPELRQKYQRARTEALAAATARARTCAGVQDWECAWSEADYGLRLEPASAELAALHRDAGRHAGVLRAQRAEEASSRGDHRGALELLASARAVSTDPSVAAAADRVQPDVVLGARREATRLRQARQFAPAIELLTLAGAMDPAARRDLDAARAEYEAWNTSEYERLAAEGDEHLAGGRWSEAEASYAAALQLRGGGRAVALARYAREMRDGDAALQARDFERAAEAYQRAVDTGADAEGLAAQLLERVQLRPYALQLRSVLVEPVRPDGSPWAGGWNRDLDRAVRSHGAGPAHARGRGPPPARRGHEDDGYRHLDRVPRENQPALVVFVDLPDGRRLATASRRALYATFDASVVIDSNGYDDRAISIRVAHEVGGRLHDIGVVAVPLGEAVAQRELALADGSIAEIRVAASPTDLPEGAFSGLTPVSDAANVAPAWSRPAPGARGFRIVAVEASAAGPAVAGRPPPALFVEVEQRGVVVYRSPVSQGRAAWSPASAWLFVQRDEPVVLRVFSVTPAGNQLLVTERFASWAAEPRTIERSSATGSVRLRLEPRRAGVARPVTAAQR